MHLERKTNWKQTQFHSYLLTARRKLVTSFKQSNIVIMANIRKLPISFRGRFQKNFPDIITHSQFYSDMISIKLFHHILLSGLILAMNAWYKSPSQAQSAIQISCRHQDVSSRGFN